LQRHDLNDSFNQWNCFLSLCTRAILQSSKSCVQSWMAQLNRPSSSWCPAKQDFSVDTLTIGARVHPRPRLFCNKPLRIPQGYHAGLPCTTASPERGYPPTRSIFIAHVRVKGVPIRVPAVPLPSLLKLPYSSHTGCVPCLRLQHVSNLWRLGIQKFGAPEVIVGPHRCWTIVRSNRRLGCAYRARSLIWVVDSCLVSS
jgi:hypothetical protein